MGDALGEVLCICCSCLCHVGEAFANNPECAKDCLCCVCGLLSQCNPSHTEQCVEQCCTGFCHCLECCASMCASSTTNTNFQYTIIDCGDARKGLSVAALCAVLLAVFLICLGAVCLVTAYRFGNNHCKEPIDTHVVVQGIAVIGDGLVLIYVVVNYYLPTDITFPLADKSVFPRFHGLFVKDIRLGFLLGIVSLGFWWSLLGYYWLSGVTCDPGDDFLLTMDSFAIGVEFLVVLTFLVGVYCVLGIAACDEGSCRLEQLELDCFLCCCGCCLKAPIAWKKRHEESLRASRLNYPAHRHKCLDFSMSTLMLCGCIRYKYSRDRPAPPSEVPDLTEIELEEVNMPAESRAQHVDVAVYPPNELPRNQEEVGRPLSVQEVNLRETPE